MSWRADKHTEEQQSEPIRFLFPSFLHTEPKKDEIYSSFKNVIYLFESRVDFIQKFIKQSKLLKFYKVELSKHIPCT